MVVVSQQESVVVWLGDLWPRAEVTSLFALLGLLPPCPPLVQSTFQMGLRNGPFTEALPAPLSDPDGGGPRPQLGRGPW